MRETLLTDLAKSGSSNPSSPWQKAFAAKKIRKVRRRKDTQILQTNPIDRVNRTRSTDPVMSGGPLAEAQGLQQPRSQLRKSNWIWMMM